MESINELVAWVGLDRGPRRVGHASDSLIPNTDRGFPRDLVSLVSNMVDCRHHFAEARRAGRQAEARFWLTLAIAYRDAIRQWQCVGGYYDAVRYTKDEVPF